MQHPDEGTFHAWLDSALPDEESRAVEEHVASCADCAARVAEARGLVAGASRILGALDDVPARVVPATGPRPRFAPRNVWWPRPGVRMAAAMAIVAVGTTMFVTRDWQQMVPTASESAAPVILRATDSARRVDVPAAASTRAPAEPEASADVTRLAPALRADTGQSVPARPPAPAAGAARQAQDLSAVERLPEKLAAAAMPATPTRADAETDRRDTAAADARTGVAGGVASPERRAVMRDSVAVVEMPRLANVARAPRGRTEVRAREAAPPIVGGQTLMTTATELAGCYALELRQTYDGSSPVLPRVVQLALSTRDAADALVAPPAQGFNRSQLPLLVPPAMDSAQLGWHLAADDSVAVRLASEGRAVLLTFPTVVSEPRMGFATTPELPGVPSWTGRVLVQRVPCP
jgi:hypothetical protein